MRSVCRGFTASRLLTAGAASPRAVPGAGQCGHREGPESPCAGAHVGAGTLPSCSARHLSLMTGVRQLA